MTHPTDEELDALVLWLEELPCCHDGPHETSARCKSCEKTVADAITTLRAQLAEAKADKEKLGRELNLARYGQPDFSWQVHKEALAEANARADRAEAALAAKPSPDEHYDDYCIGQFAKMMSEKMAASRAKGRSGWNDPEKCSVEYLRSLLYEHLDKGDPVDVANFCMMLRHYEASTYREACNCQPQPSPDVAALEDEIAKLSDLCDCDCNDDDCVRCSHYPAILDQKRAALALVKGGDA